MADTVTLVCNGCDDLVTGWRQIGPDQFVHTSHPVTCVQSEVHDA